jgi:inner membrane protein
MDNVCHTLVGAACARAGLTRQTRLGMVTSMIAANLPDLDVLVFATDVPSVAFRRGWTHGVLAQAVLPVLFACVMLVVARRLANSSGRHDPPASLGPLLMLSYVGVLSHVLLDYLNNYGVRLLMPFSRRWFYGDALFIVDPWLWLAFGAAVLLGRRGAIRQTRGWLIVSAIYILCMIGSARAARAVVLDTWQREQGALPEALMVGPVPINPFQKAVIVDAGDHYRAGTFTWLPQRTVLDAAKVPKHDRHSAVSEARRDPRVAGILVWARFPFWTIEPAADATRVTVRDMRFAAIGSGGFSATTVVR